MHTEKNVLVIATRMTNGMCMAKMNVKHADGGTTEEFCKQVPVMRWVNSAGYTSFMKTYVGLMAG